MRIDGPLQFNCIAIATENYSLSKVNTLSSLDCRVCLWLCVIPFPFKLNQTFLNPSWRSPGWNKSGPLALLLYPPSYHLPCSDSSHASVIMNLLRTFPSSSWKSTWEEPKGPLGPPLSNERALSRNQTKSHAPPPSLIINGNQQKKTLGFPMWLAISHEPVIS
jgi:hypothetical protein